MANLFKTLKRLGGLVVDGVEGTVNFIDDTVKNRDTNFVGDVTKAVKLTVGTAGEALKAYNSFLEMNNFEGEANGTALALSLKTNKQLINVINNSLISGSKEEELLKVLSSKDKVWELKLELAQDLVKDFNERAKDIKDVKVLMKELEELSEQFDKLELTFLQKILGE